jgi:serine protease AprX
VTKHSVRPATRVWRTLLALIGAIATFVTAGAAPAQAGLIGNLLGTVVGVVSTLTDTTLGLLTGADWGYSSSTTTMSSVDNTIGASTMWSRGYTGQGVGVALLDTGAVPVQGLTHGNVVNGPDLSLDSPSTGLREYDGFGHGTHMAGNIAGNDGTSTGFKGVAPDATLLNMRVGSSSGATDVSQVIAGLDWVVQHRNDNGMNIRVVNLSYGTDGVQSYQADPLAKAVENAWKAGIVVVVAGGNTGTTRPTLDNPATDPYVIAVGADDTVGTTSSLDDTVPQFSSRGSATRHVDLTAPGQSIASLRDPGSVIDKEYPKAVVDTRYFKGSGSSQAAAVVSGAVALLLQQRPTLTPDQVKALLTLTAQATPKADTAGRGAGLLNVAAAGTASIVGIGTQSWPASSGLGTLEGARGTQHVTDNNTELTGERDVFGKPWSGAAWAPKSASSSAWTGGSWNGSTWTGTCWCVTSWTPSTYASTTWTGADWAGVGWTSHSWSAESWSSHSWSGSGWVSHSWSSHSWSGSTWS